MRDCARSLVGCAVLLLTLTGCAAAVDGSPGSASPSPSRAEQGTVPTPIGTGTRASTRLGLAAAPAALHDRIDLGSSRVRPGATIKGTFVITNTGGRHLDLNPGGCRAKFGVQLTNSRVAPGLNFIAECAPAPSFIAPGTTRIPITVDTTYEGCNGPPRPSGSFVPCLAHGRIPPLPAGTYQAVLVGDGRTRLPPAKPVTVILVR